MQHMPCHCVNMAEVIHMTIWEPDTPTSGMLVQKGGVDSPQLSTGSVLSQGERCQAEGGQLLCLARELL